MLSHTQVLSIHNLQCHHAAFTKTITNKKLIDAVSDCVGSPNVLLHHTKAHIKPPEKGTAYPAHQVYRFSSYFVFILNYWQRNYEVTFVILKIQDYHYFPFENHTMVAAFVHMDDSDKENGCLMVYPGSHKLGPLTDISDNPDFHYVDQTRFPVEKAYPVIAKKGQVVIFSYLTVHASFPNVSSRTRRMFLMQVNFHLIFIHLEFGYIMWTKLIMLQTFTVEGCRRSSYKTGAFIPLPRHGTSRNKRSKEWWHGE